jgi:hypothetical protein
MNVRAVSVLGLVFFGALSLADLVLTWALIVLGGGTVYESNPVAGAWLADYGWRGLLVFKVLAAGLVVAVTFLLVRYRPWAALAIVLFACVAVGMVVWHSYSLLQAIP